MKILQSFQLDIQLEAPVDRMFVGLLGLQPVLWAEECSSQEWAVQKRNKEIVCFQEAAEEWMPAEKCYFYDKQCKNMKSTFKFVS